VAARGCAFPDGRAEHEQDEGERCRDAGESTFAREAVADGDEGEAGRRRQRGEDEPEGETVGSGHVGEKSGERDAGRKQAGAHPPKVRRSAGRSCTSDRCQTPGNIY